MCLSWELNLPWRWFNFKKWDLVKYMNFPANTAFFFSSQLMLPSLFKFLFLESVKIFFQVAGLTFQVKPPVVDSCDLGIGGWSQVGNPRSVLHPAVLHRSFSFRHFKKNIKYKKTKQKKPQKKFKLHLKLYFGTQSAS